MPCTFPPIFHSVCRFPLPGLHCRLSLPTGVFLPVHRVRGLHHAAVLHAGRHHRQRADLGLAHARAKHLLVDNS